MDGTPDSVAGSTLVTLPVSSGRCHGTSTLQRLLHLSYINGPSDIPTKPESEPNPCWFYPPRLMSEGGVGAERSPKESSHVQNNFRTTAAHQKFKKAHRFIYIFKSVKPDVVLSYYKYKN